MVGEVIGIIMDLYYFIKKINIFGRFSHGPMADVKNVICQSGSQREATVDYCDDHLDHDYFFFVFSGFNNLRDRELNKR